MDGDGLVVDFEVLAFVVVVVDEGDVFEVVKNGEDVSRFLESWCFVVS